MPKGIDTIDVVVLCLSSPPKVGIYKENVLKKEFALEGKSSEHLPLIFDFIIKNYTLNRVVYSNGPGSFTAIKVSYAYLKTLQIIKGFELLSVDGFYFNNNSPIKCFGNLYFVKDENGISIKSLNLPKESVFSLKKEFYSSCFSSDVEPLYIVPAV